METRCSLTPFISSVHRWAEITQRHLLHESLSRPLIGWSGGRRAGGSRSAFVVSLPVPRRHYRCTRVCFTGVRVWPTAAHTTPLVLLIHDPPPPHVSVLQTNTQYLSHLYKTSCLTSWHHADERLHQEIRQMFSFVFYSCNITYIDKNHFYSQTQPNKDLSGWLLSGVQHLDGLLFSVSCFLSLLHLRHFVYFYEPTVQHLLISVEQRRVHDLVL